MTGKDVNSASGNEGNVDASAEEELGTYNIYIMGKRYKVPVGLTIMTAIEYAGYQFIRSCGCRGWGRVEAEFEAVDKQPLVQRRRR